MLQDGFWTCLYNLQTARFKSPEIGTEFGSLNVKHVKTKEKGPRYLDGMCKKEGLDGSLPARRLSLPPALLF